MLTRLSDAKINNECPSAQKFHCRKNAWGWGLSPKYGFHATVMRNEDKECSDANLMVIGKSLLSHTKGNMRGRDFRVSIHSDNQGHSICSHRAHTLNYTYFITTTCYISHYSVL